VSSASGTAFAQTKTGQLVHEVPGNYLEQTGAQPRFVRFNQLPAALTAALRAGPTASAATASVRTIPYFSGAFTFKSTPYPYFMVVAIRFAGARRG